MQGPDVILPLLRLQSTALYMGATQAAAAAQHLAHGPRHSLDSFGAHLRMLFGLMPTKAVLLQGPSMLFCNGPLAAEALAGRRR
mmetsp:Transcript_145316/g.256196  ORF Transcript_145316/g.256196 Transcript_145316/m.256196 type:complete len:84 (+) Transcript_145316:40-291(+)